MFDFARKQKWILTELKYINMLGIVGALTFFSDALQSKLGTIFISHTSGTEIDNRVSALFLGQAVMGCTGYVVAQGLATGVSTLCSQAYGAGNYKLMGVYFMRALTLASLSCFPIWTIWLSVEPVIYYLTLNSELSKGAGDYTAILCFSYPAYIYSRLACNFLQSQNILLPSFAIQVTGNILNIGLQYVLVVVFQLEIKGVALSYVVSTYLIAILIYTYFRFTSVHLTYSTFSWAYFSQWSHFLKYGMVGTFQFILDVFMGRVGPIIFLGFILKDTKQVALLGIFNAVWALFMAFSYGFGIGANVRVANLLGQNRIQRTKRAIIVITSFIFAIEITFGILLFALSHYISCMFTSVEEMREQIEFGIRIVSVCLVSDIECTLRGICNACCLQGLVLVAKFICTIPIAYSLGCLLAYFVSWRSAGYSLFIAFGFLISAIAYAVILYCYSWDKIHARVVRNTLQYSTSEPSEERSDLLPKDLLPKVKWPLILRKLADKNSTQVPIDPLSFLKECKEEAQMRGEGRKAQEIRTLIWKIQDMSDVPGKKDEINKMLADAGLFELEDKPTPKPSELSSTEKLIRVNEKKLKDIQKLKEKQKSGVSLEKNQREKIGKEMELKKELEELRSIVETVASESDL